MPARVTCILCSKRVETNKPRVRVGSDSIWPLFVLHVQNIGLNRDRFSTGDFICMKCYGTISHQRMSDRGPNKKLKVEKPIDRELIITKKVLRSVEKNKNVDANQEADETNGISVRYFGQSARLTLNFDILVLRLPFVRSDPIFTNCSLPFLDQCKILRMLETKQLWTRMWILLSQSV